MDDILQVAATLSAAAVKARSDRDQGSHKSSAAATMVISSIRQVLDVNGRDDFSVRLLLLLALQLLWTQMSSMLHVDSALSCPATPQRVCSKLNTSVKCIHVNLSRIVAALHATHNHQISDMLSESIVAYV